MIKRLEEKILGILLERQNKRRYDTINVTYQDCMDLMFVLSRRMDTIEKKVGKILNEKSDTERHN